MRPKKNLHVKKKHSAQEKPFPVLPAAAGLISLLGLVAFFATNNGAEPDTGLAQTQPVQVEGRSLPEFDPAGEDPAEGTLAPTLQGASFDGTPLTIGPDGRAKLLVFVAHWCPQCRREVPELAEWLQDEGAPDYVDIYAIATASDPNRPNFPPSEWLEREGFEAPALADDQNGTAADAFGLNAFPYLVLVSSGGEVLDRFSGEFSTDQLEEMLARAEDGE